jgi:hypothetical protein
MTRYGDRAAALFAIHALAITYHNQAIAHELAFGTGTTEWTEQLWVKALTYWAKIVAAEDFWAYLRQRVFDRDDPRVKPDDVEEVRTHLPAVLLGFHALFALAYDRVGEVTACDKHLALLHPTAYAGSRERAAQCHGKGVAAAIYQELYSIARRGLCHLSLSGARPPPSCLIGCSHAV